MKKRPEPEDAFPGRAAESPQRRVAEGPVGRIVEGSMGRVPGVVFNIDIFHDVVSGLTDGRVTHATFQINIGDPIAGPVDRVADGPADRSSSGLPELEAVAFRINCHGLLPR